MHWNRGESGGVGDGGGEKKALGAACDAMAL